MGVFFFFKIIKYARTAYETIFRNILERFSKIIHRMDPRFYEFFSVQIRKFSEILHLRNPF